MQDRNEKQRDGGSQGGLLALAERRRSIRRYTGEPVQEDSLNRTLRIASLAPSSYGQQPVEFVVVTDKFMLNALADAKSIGAPSVRNSTASVVVICDVSKGELWIEDASVAAAFLLLAAEEEGLGACWNQIRGRSGRKSTSSEEIRQLLGIPSRYEVLCIVSLGHKLAQPRPRSPLYQVSRVHKELFDRRPK